MTEPDATTLEELAQRISGLRERVGLLGEYLDPEHMAGRQQELEDVMQ